MNKSDFSTSHTVPEGDRTVILHLCDVMARLYLIRNEFEEMTGANPDFSNAIGESIGCCEEAIAKRVEHSVIP